jgi:hypothetical protein
MLTVIDAVVQGRISPEGDADMPARSRAPGRVPVRGKHWKRSMSIASEKYSLVSKAILASLPTDPIRYSELVARVRTRLPDFPGSVSWYTISVARQLELDGLLIRNTKPVLYSKPAKGEAKPVAGHGGKSRGGKARARKPGAAR